MQSFPYPNDAPEKQIFKVKFILISSYFPAIY